MNLGQQTPREGGKEGMRGCGRQCDDDGIGNLRRRKGIGDDIGGGWMGRMKAAWGTQWHMRPWVILTGGMRMRMDWNRG